MTAGTWPTTDVRSASDRRTVAAAASEAAAAIPRHRGRTRRGSLRQRPGRRRTTRPRRPAGEMGEALSRHVEPVTVSPHSGSSDRRGESSDALLASGSAPSDDSLAELRSSGGVTRLDGRRRLDRRATSRPLRGNRRVTVSATVAAPGSRTGHPAGPAYTSARAKSRIRLAAGVGPDGAEAMPRWLFVGERRAYRGVSVEVYRLPRFESRAVSTAENRSFILLPAVVVTDVGFRGTRR